MTHLIDKIKELVKAVEPSAEIIVFGSQARGDADSTSDIDVLILVDKENVTRADQKRIKYPLYDLEFEFGKIISPLVISKKRWYAKHRFTPLYENIEDEGIVL